MTHDKNKLIYYALSTVSILLFGIVSIRYHVITGYDNKTIRSSYSPGSGRWQNATNFPTSIRAPLEANAACLWLVLLGLLDWIVYTFLTIFHYKAESSNERVYTLPGVQSERVIVCIGISTAIAALHYILITDGYNSWLNVGLLSLSVKFLGAAIGTAAKDNKENSQKLISLGAPQQSYLPKLFVVNAMLPLAAWVFIEAFVNVTVIVWRSSIEAQMTVLTIALAIIFLAFVATFILELVFRAQCFGFLLHYLILLAYACGVHANTAVVPESHGVYVLPVVMIVTSILQFSTKLGFVIKASFIPSGPEHEPIN